MSDAAKPSPDEHCRLCGHTCLARRSAGDRGRCGAGSLVGFSASLQHYGEEPPFSGGEDTPGGSGTIFFTRCVLRCVFCQNWQISQAASGTDITVEQLAETMLELQAKGALNINLVSPTPYVAQIAMALNRAKNEGLTLPIIYNTGGYDSLTALSLMDGLVDIYLPDAKMAPPAASDPDEPDSQSARLLGAGDYPKINRIALKEMYRQVGPLRLDSRGLAYKGFLVRHLVLPDNLARTSEMLPWLSDTFGSTVHLSLMAQYHPTHLVKSQPEEFRAYPGLSRPLSIREYEDAIDLALDSGLENTFIQDLESAVNYLPDFNRPKVFSH
ncbi:radical SAM protein [Deltaproteobacteria bacterium Smac51]|nr:radical SAM protein [Deltaproteobacteria bacterium Smac51]